MSTPPIQSLSALRKRSMRCSPATTPSTFRTPSFVDCNSMPASRGCTSPPASAAWVFAPICSARSSSSFVLLALRAPIRRRSSWRLRVQPSSPTAPTNSAAAFCARCSPAKSVGASCSANPAPEATLLASPPRQFATATSGSSMVKRCGTPLPTSPTGECSSPARTLTCPSTKA